MIAQRSAKLFVLLFLCGILACGGGNGDGDDPPAMEELDVTINQIDPACPAAGDVVKVYVSVLNQAGFTVTGLTVPNFQIGESGNPPMLPTSAENIETAANTLSVVLMLDYSGSIIEEPDNLTRMEEGAKTFVRQLGVNDEAAILKYATQTEVSQSFTNNKTLLINAIDSTPDVGNLTALYDAMISAVAEISDRTKDRRVIIVFTDGVDSDGTGTPISVHTLNEAIAAANQAGVSVFTVGLGSGIDPIILQQIADQTGGAFFDSVSAANLTTIYQQLADLLLSGQYILTFTSNGPGAITVTADSESALPGFDTIVPICGGGI